jgi:hypothetical protein
MRPQELFLLVLFAVLQGAVAQGVPEKGSAQLTTLTTNRLLRYRPANTKRKSRYKVQLLLPASTMDGFLGDRGSVDYQQKSRALTNDILQLFAKTGGVQRVYNMQFSSYKRPQDDHAGVNKPNNWQKEIVIQPSSSDDGPSSFMVPSALQTLKAPTTIITRQNNSTAFTTAVPSTSVGLLSTTPRARQSRRRKSSTTKKSTTSTESTSTTTETPTTQSRENVFNVERITGLFKECYHKPPGSREYQLLLEPYLDAYTELLSIFTILGPIFSFAKADADAKLIILRQLRQSDIDKNQTNYVTFQSMFAYEYSPEGAVANLDGVSNNKWIHRPLKLISGIIKSVQDDKSEKSLGSQVQDIYSEILAPHHQWYVRATVYLALLSFPSRISLIAKLGRQDSPEDRQAFADMNSAIDAVYDDIEGLYLKYSPGSH